MPPDEHQKAYNRVHQFTKIEMFAYTLPDQSDAVHEELRQIECELFDALEIPYRVVDLLRPGTLVVQPFENMIWKHGCQVGVMPGEWGEVTSTSNCTDYQARRLESRYKVKGEKGTNFVHHLKRNRNCLQSCDHRDT